MKNILKYFIFIFVIFFSFCFKVNADCSYDERKKLSEKAREVEIIVNPKVKIQKVKGESSFGEEEEYVKEIHSFKFSIYNISNDIFIKYYKKDDEDNKIFINSNDIKNGVYTFTDLDSGNVATYKFEIYSTNNNCYGKLISTKTVKKPRYNLYSSYGICKEKELEDYKYCQKYLKEDNNITEAEFVERANNYKNSKKETLPKEEPKPEVIDYVKNYWYCAIPIIIVPLGIIIVVKIRKKRSEL